MVEVFNIGIGQHERYAQDQEMVEKFQEQYHMPPAGARYIAGQTKILDLVPKQPALELLMQTQKRKSWAQFKSPQNFYNQSYASQFIVPSLGPIEKQDADIARIRAILEEEGDGQEEGDQPTEEEEGDGQEEGDQPTEGEILLDLLMTVRDTNEMIDYVHSRIGQFLQG
ncbi:MAG: hypothetical protein S4CHLAM45_08000 [Chlamydiales bacterium]|nr:hypothetical protein [Chlamydiales bacterium]MCH9619990.1 hypothetical protein [Chlamydiales bacterium]MCH9622906.1 hypothetical protein [Chlamydiales bacterium]